jgi:hypothetical protein
LKSLNLAQNNRCGVYFNDMLLAIAENCPTLEHIDLSWGQCSPNEDGGIKTLFEKCTQLKSIDLSFFVFISDVSLVLIAQNCPHLSHIVVAIDSRGITEAGLTALKENNPSLTITRVAI